MNVFKKENNIKSINSNRRIKVVLSSSDDGATKHAFPYNVKKTIVGLILSGGGMTQEEADARYLKLDQSSIQSVINGLPLFAEGISVGDATTYVTKVAPDTFQLWVNGALRHSWTTEVVVADSYPMGAWLFWFPKE